MNGCLTINAVFLSVIHEDYCLFKVPDPLHLETWDNSSPSGVFDDFEILRLRSKQIVYILVVDFHVADPDIEFILVISFSDEIENIANTTRKYSRIVRLS